MKVGDTVMIFVSGFRVNNFCTLSKIKTVTKTGRYRVMDKRYSNELFSDGRVTKNGFYIKPFDEEKYNRIKAEKERSTLVAMCMDFFEYYSKANSLTFEQLKKICEIAGIKENDT